MKTSITIDGNDIKIAFAPESDIERLSLSELGDDVSISRSHQSLVLRRRSAQIRKIGEVGLVEEAAKS